MSLTGKDLILATRPFAKETVWKSWMHTLTTLGLMGALVCGLIWFTPLYGKLICAVFLGLLMVRFFVIYHDFEHHAILHNSRAGKIIFTIYGIFILAPSSIWKRSHDYHHKHNSKLFSASIGSYPIMTREKYQESTKNERFVYLFTRHPLTILFGYFSMFFYGMCLQSFISSPRRHWDSLLAVTIHVAGAAAIIFFFGWVMWLVVFFVPFFIAFMLGAYLFYAQHNFPGVTFADNGGWTYVNAAVESSSFMKMNPFWRYVTANIGYHHIHHINARIPFYRLPETMRSIPELQQVKITTLNPLDVAACFRLKIWDSAQQKMITLREFRQGLAIVRPVVPVK